MKKFIFRNIICCLLLPFIVLFAAKTEELKAAALSDTSVTLYLGEEEKEVCQLSVLGIEKGSTVRFSSSDKTIATVGAKTGTVTGRTPGRAVITCTITKKDGTAENLKATVYVKDNVRKITLGLSDAAVRPNALKKHTDYTLSCSFKTVAGTDENTGNYLYYEALDTANAVSANASVTQEGVFRAIKSGTYTIKVYCFQGKSFYNKWITDRTKYASYILAEDSLELTVTLKNFSVEEGSVHGWNVALPERFEVSNAAYEDGAVTFSIYALKEDKTASLSNIQVRIDSASQPPDFKDLQESITKAYTKTVIADSWKEAYNAGLATVKNLEQEIFLMDKKAVIKISYEIVLKDILLSFGGLEDISIDRLAYYNTIYTWYDGMDHLTVNVTDTYEGLQPNITEAAERLVKNLTANDTDS